MYAYSQQKEQPKPAGEQEILQLLYSSRQEVEFEYKVGSI